MVESIKYEFVLKNGFLVPVMVWCIYYLAFHPDIQEKVYKEMIEILGEETIDANVSSEL